MLIFFFVTSFAFAIPEQAPKQVEISDIKDLNLREKITQKEKEHSVPRDTVPVEEIKYLIDTPIPSTAHYLPLLQPLLNIQVGTLPNPLGISIIGSYTDERYEITKFKGMLSPNLTGDNIVNTLQPMIARDQKKINEAIDAAFPGLKNLVIRTGLKILVDGIAKNNPTMINFLKNLINNAGGAAGVGQSREWALTDAKVRTKTKAIGAKADIWLLPFMNLFATAAYLNVEQSTSIGTATIKLDGSPIPNLNSLTFPIGVLENKLDGYVVMGGTNLAIGYKGFFASFMFAGGYVQLDDSQNNIKGFVQKPFMYYGPRIGYSYNGIFTIHTGLQRIELLGATEGKDLSKLTGGLVSNYSVEIKKFPVNFLAGVQFMFMRDLGISVEYVGSPDTNGLNAELAVRF